MKEVNPYSKTKWVHIRLTHAEHKIITDKRARSTCRNLSQYIRNVIFDRPIVATYRNRSQDDMTQQLSVLNRELNAMGNNLNQITKRLHTIQTSEDSSWGSQFSIQSGAIMLKIAEVKEMVHKIAERWLR